MESGFEPDRVQELYLWLNCERWVRFGPFAWLRFDDAAGPRIAPDGEPVRPSARQMAFNAFSSRSASWLNRHQLDAPAHPVAYRIFRYPL